MNFQTRSVYPQEKGVRYTYKPQSRFASFSQRQDKEKRQKRVIGTLLAICLIFSFWLTKNVVQWLPDVSSINSMIFSEATVIQDRNGVVLYKLFEQNREYVPFSGISQNMINGIIAVEDQRYWEHNGLDPMGILRAGISNVFHPEKGLQGASTIPQQLVRNLLLSKGQTFMEKVTRKLKEMILTSKLDSVLEKQIKKEKTSLDSTELRKEMKNKILELYLNYISFWNNAFGVESASKTYFDKSAKDLDVFEAAVLSSIPKWPSVYNPYKNPGKVVGSFVIKGANGETVDLTWEIATQIQATFSEKLMNMSISKKDSDFTKTLSSLGKFWITWPGGISLEVTYTPWRKDAVITRMYEDGYITENQAKQAFLEGITYKFRKNKIDMLAPHFVQWIVELLEKQYDTGTLLKGGIIVKTSLDYEIQKLAEESLSSNLAVLQQNGADNSAMIYTDSQNGDVLAYVGSLNYFDEGIQWQNDMVRKPRQSGSSIKPFIYALWFEKLPLTIDTPIFDIPFQIGPDRPSNADDSFSGLLPLRYALGHSRNIPSAKMITALGGEAIAKPFLISLWLSGIQENVEYGYTLALWAGEVSMLELSNAYMHLSTPTPWVINPILEIRARDWSLIYQKQVEKQKDIIKPGIWYLLRKILSEPGNRLAGWINKFNVPWLSLAIKTGTSNVKTDKGNRPRDGWLASYNGTKVALFRAGNANATPLNKNAFGGTIQADPMKKFYTALLKNNYITNDVINQVDVANVTISKLSGKIANTNTPQAFAVNTMYYTKWVPLGSDGWATNIDYDIACNWAASPVTPASELRKWYLISPSSFMPNNMDIKEITEWFKIGTMFTGESKESYSSGNVLYNFNNIFTELPTKICDSRVLKEDLSIQINIMEPKPSANVSQKFTLWYDIVSSKPIDRIVLFSDNQQVKEFPGKGKTTLSEIQSIASTIGTGTHTMSLVVINNEGFSNKKDFTLTIVGSDTKAPEVVTDKTVIKKMADGKYQVTLILQDDLSSITKWSITRDGVSLSTFDWNIVGFITTDLSPVLVSATDAYGNKGEYTIQLPNQ